MHAAFGIVIWVVVAVGVVVAIVSLLTTRKTWEDYSKDGLVRDSDAPRVPAPGSAAAIAERESEIRALVEARNAVRARRGEPPIDVEQELARVAAPNIDPDLRAEIRDLVVARNYRRAKSGKPPLDVEAEVKREIARISGRL